MTRARISRSTRHLRVAFAVLLIGLPQAACVRQEAAKAQGSAPAGADMPEVVARIGNDSVTAADIRRRVGEELERIEVEYLLNRSRLIQTTIETVVRERLLDAEARRLGKSAEDLVQAEAGAELNPSDAEVAAWFQENQARLGGRSLDQLRPQIAQFLRDQRRQEASDRLYQRLATERGVTTLYNPYRIEFNNEGAPYLGNREAPVTVVEFSDFQCPFCQRFAPVLKELERNFGDQVHVVYRQFPIAAIHPFAFKASEASLCAHEQGMFWQMHDLMFAEQTTLGIPELKAKAGRIGVDQGRFDRCLDSGQYAQQVQRDIQEATRAGVNGTPAVFINGQALGGGAVPYEVVAAAVEAELARTRRDGAAARR